MGPARSSESDHFSATCVALEARSKSPWTVSVQACDRCRIKKIKCNLKRPTCSRCTDDNAHCLYTFVRKKPGPAKGSRQRPSKGRVDLSVDESPAQASIAWPSVSLPSLYPPATFEMTPSTTFIPPWQVVDADFCLPTPGPTTMDPRQALEQERQLLEDYFQHVQSSIPLLRRKSFMPKFEAGQVDRHLLHTILAIVAKVRGMKHVWTDTTPESYLRGRLDAQAHAEQVIDSLASLDTARESCLLAFYEFHQYPGHRAGLRIGNLARGAYQRGLHQLDNKDHCPLYDGMTLTEEEVEDWRHLWWCIYCFDSYSNITAGTPFEVEVGSIRTALLSTHPSVSEPSTTASFAPIFLAAETEDLWKTVKEIMNHGQNETANIQIVTQTALRSASALCRTWRFNPSAKVYEQLELMENYISAIRLALSPRRLAVARDVAANESSAAHHSRLIYLLHLHACRMTLTGGVPHEQEPAWLRNWQSTLEICEDIVAVAKHWDPERCSSSEPAICFIVAWALILVHLHSTDPACSELLHSKLSSFRALLLLFLEQFASLWTLPRFLIMSLHNFCNVVQEALSPMEIQQLLNRQLGMLHRNWFKMVSLEPGAVHPPTLPGLFESGFLSESDFTDWASWQSV